MFHLKKSGCRGYTLIEVVVAVAIFTTMLMLGSIALNQTLMQYKALAQKGFSFWQYARVVWLDKSIGSMTDYYVNTKKDGWFPYFKGDMNGFSYVSLSPFVGDSPCVVWVLKEKNEKGTYSLTYYELPVIMKKYDEIENAFFFGDYKKGNSYTVISNAESVYFQYYGFDVFKRKYDWFNEFEGKLKKTLPAAIMITYKTEQEEKKLILKVNTNSMMKVIYNEIYQQ